MHVYDLKPSDRDKVIAMAKDLTRPLWPYTPDGAMAHAKFVQLLKDLGSTKRDTEVWRKRHQTELDKWNEDVEFWYVEPFGILKEFLQRLMDKWAFTGPGQDLPAVKHSIKVKPMQMEGTQVCIRCNKEHHITKYWKGPHYANGRVPECKYCMKRVNKR